MSPCALWAEELDPCCRFTADTVLVQQCLAAATEVVWALSGRRFGICDLEVRPCRRRCASTIPNGFSFWGQTMPWPSVGMLDRVLWLTCDCPADACSCTTASTLELRAPIVSVSEVWVDGQAIQASATGGWRVDEQRLLVRLDGETWPDCSDFSAAKDEAGSFVVRWSFGVEPPVSGQMAVQDLACEMLKKCTGDRDCALPKRVTSITRQGVSFAMLDPMEFLNEGKTGIYGVDLFLRSYNPRGLQRRARVFRADAAPVGRRVGT